MANLKLVEKSPLLNNIPTESTVWMSHADLVSQLAPDFDSIAITQNSNYAAVQHKEKAIYGLQFHPEVNHTQYGMKVLENFCFKIVRVKLNRNENWHANR